MNRAADLCSDSAGLVNDNERRWRVFRQRVIEVVERGRGAQLPAVAGSPFHLELVAA